MSRLGSSRLLCAATFIASLSAQDPIDDDQRQDLFSGLGRTTFGPLLVQPLTGQGSNLGVAFLAGEIYISSRGNGGGGTGPHSCTVIDMQGNVVRQFQQIGSQASVWGWRDGASDGSSTLVFGYENTIEFVNPIGARATSIIAANGPQSVTSPLFPTYTGTALGTNRALAFDPNGNGGNGSLWVANFGSDLVELDLAGVEINRLPHDGSWSFYGIALNPTTGRLWGNSSPNSAGGGTGKIVEIDLATGLPTGAEFDHVSGAQGGLAVVPGGVDGRGRGVDLLSLIQTQTIQGHRIDLYDGVDGTDDVKLLAGIDGGPLSVARRLASYPIHATWTLDLDDGDPTPRVLDLAAFAINIPAFAAVDGRLDTLTASLLPSLVELRYQDAFTTPGGVALYVPTTEAAGPLNLAMGPMRSPTLTMHADFIRVQAIYGDLNVPPTLGPQVMFTNQTRLWF